MDFSLQISNSRGYSTLRKQTKLTSLLRPLRREAPPVRNIRKGLQIGPWRACTFRKQIEIRSGNQLQLNVVS